MKKRIIVLGFGGTIAMVPDARGVLKPAKTVEEIIAIVPSLTGMADVEFEELENRDSTNINPGHWAKLAIKIAALHDQYDGVLVTHGTDTMAYTAGAVALALGRGLKIPIVFTGSQLPLVSFGTDARFNLENSIKAILEPILKIPRAAILANFAWRKERGRRCTHRYFEDEPTQRSGEIGRIPKGFRYFFAPRRCVFGEVAMATISLPRLAEQKNSRKRDFAVLLRWVLITASEERVAEVMIVFSDMVLRGARAIKISESRFPAFDSPAFPYLARITAMGISFIPDALRKDRNVPFEPKTHFQRGILAIDLTPGLEPSILLEIVRSGKCQGLLLKSLGAGNVPSEDEYSLIPLIEEATKLNVPVLISTKFVGGNTHMDLYEPGKLALDAGAIPTGDLTDVMAQVKFMWALAQGHRSSAELRKVVNTSFIGEITA